MRTRRTALNRAVLAVTGLALLLGGLWLASAGAPAGTRPPAWWPPVPADHAFLTGERVTGLRARGWWLPAVMAGSLAATALSALWCARQFRAGGSPRLLLPVAGGTVRTRALEEALTRDAAMLHGVARCRTRVLAFRGRLTVRLHLWLQPDTTPAAVLPGVTELVARAETAAAPCAVRSRVRLSGRSHRVPHVR